MNAARKRILIHKITNLPTLPTILQKIIDLTERRSANAHDLGRLLSKDPSISAVILKLVNSAYYGNLRHIASIDHAIVLLGFQMIKTIAMGVTIYGDRTGSGGRFDREKFWQHSLGTASLARVIATEAALPDHLDGDTVFLSGLLHDVGKVILDNYFPDDYGRVTEIVAERGVWIGVAEREVMGLDHAEAGYHLARKWQFPHAIADAIRHHHQPEHCPEDHGFLCATVHAADHCCRRIGLGSGGDDTLPELDPHIDRFGIDDSVLERAVAHIEAERHQIEEFVIGTAA